MEIHKKEYLNNQEKYENLLKFASYHGNKNSNYAEELESFHSLISVEVSDKINVIPAF